MNDSNYTIWIIAGESSGDAYGAALAQELRQLQPAVTLRGMGGEAMAAAGVDLLVDSSELGIVGLVEVIKHLPLIRTIFKNLQQRAAQERPDAVVLIDYPGFNLRLAKQLHKLGLRVVYYVSPQVWAWGRKRIPKIAAVVDKMLVIFPFETDVYAATDLEVEFVGHPLLEILAGYRIQEERDQDLLLLLPGSRTSEINRLLPVMLDTAVQLQQEKPQLRFVIAVPRRTIADHVKEKIAEWQARNQELPKLQIVTGQTREWLQRAAAGLAASGTVTVEAAILGLPLVVIYRVHALTYWLGRYIVDVPYFTMVNLVAQGMVYEEFMQHEVVPVNLLRALKDILPGGCRRPEVEAGIQKTVGALGAHMKAANRAARAVLEVAECETAQDSGDR